MKQKINQVLLKYMDNRGFMTPLIKQHKQEFPLYNNKNLTLQIVTF